MAVQIAKIKDRVENLLRNHEHLRDSDERLMANIWWEESKDKCDTLVEFLGKYANGDFTNPESVRRIRQKLQEIHPELRGNSYEHRHRKQVDVKKELGYTP